MWFIVYNIIGDRMKKKIIIISIIILAILICGFLVIKHMTSTNYKLKKIGYTDDEIKILVDKEFDLDFALKNYNESLTKFISSKYYMLNRLDRYLEYYNNHKDTPINKIVSIVNANMDLGVYNNIKEVYPVDNLILVNKFYKLENNYIPENLTNISIQYAYDNHKLKKEVNDAYTKMAKDAKKQNITLIANVSYRSYEEQEASYNSLKSKYGTEKADNLAARSGHSEHQTGLSLNITTRLKENEEFENSQAYQFLINNSYKYGFILRYPKDMEDITGFLFEPGHFRYVGIEAAEKIYNENITFDEYYAYYIEKGIK